MGVFQEPIRLEGVFACRFGVVFHCVVARKLVVEAGGEHVHHWFEFQETSCSLKYIGVQHYVILVAFPVIWQNYRTNLVVCHAVLSVVDDDVSSYQR